MHYDFENVGGLLQVIAVPPASFVQIRKDYAAGLNYLELRNRHYKNLHRQTRRHNNGLRRLPAECTDKR